LRIFARGAAAPFKSRHKGFGGQETDLALTLRTRFPKLVLGLKTFLHRVCGQMGDLPALLTRNIRRAARIGLSRFQRTKARDRLRGVWPTFVSGVQK